MDIETARKHRDTQAKKTEAADGEARACLDAWYPQVAAVYSEHLVSRNSPSLQHWPEPQVRDLKTELEKAKAALHVRSLPDTVRRGDTTRGTVGRLPTGVFVCISSDVFTPIGTVFEDAGLSARAHTESLDIGYSQAINNSLEVHARTAQNLRDAEETLAATIAEAEADEQINRYRNL